MQNDINRIESERKHRLRLEELFTDFERQWKPDSKTQIRDFVLQVEEALRLELVHELVTIDCELRADKGQSPELSEYQAQLREWKSLVDSGFARWQESTVPNSTASDAEFQPFVLGDYNVIRKIGKGGMGVVYEAIQDSLGRRVAIKTLANLHVASLAPRFRREARAVAMLHHTNIIEVYGSGVDNEVPYFAMQLIEGKSLGQAVSEARKILAESGSSHSSSPSHSEHPKHELLGRDSRKNIAKIGVQVARALQHAHHHGVLHRDIKPSNLLIDKSGTTFVSDFGLAKLRDEKGDATLSGDVIGTLRYIPPEGVQGEWSEQSDIYSLGITLYELLALKPAYAETQNAKLLAQITSGDAPSSLSHHDSTMPLDLETIVMKAMATSPKDRYRSASDLADDLQRYVDGRPIQARRISGTERLWKWARRKPALAAFLSLSALVVTLGFPAMLFLWLRSENALQTAEQRQGETEVAMAAAVTARTKADALRASADLAREDAEAYGYGSSIQLAQRHIDDGVVYEAERLLMQWVPPPGATSTKLDSEQPVAERRGWEWNFLNNKVDASRLTLRGDPRYEVFAAVISPNESTIATVHNTGPRDSGLPGEVILWDSKTGQRKHRLQESESRVFGVAFHPNGLRLATVGLSPDDPTERGHISLWDTNTGARLKFAKLTDGYSKNFFNGFFGKHRLPGVRFSDDGKWLVSWPAQIRVFDAETLEVAFTRNKIAGYMALPMANNRLLSLNSPYLSEHDIQNGKLIKKTEQPGLYGFYFCLTNDRSSLLTTMRQKLRVCTVKQPGTFTELHVKGLHWATISPSGDTVAYCDRSGKLSLKGIGKANSQTVDSLLGHQSRINDGSFSHDGKWIVTASADQTAKVWDLTNRDLQSVELSVHAMADIAFTNNGKQLVSAAPSSTGPKAAVAPRFTGAKLNVNGSNLKQTKIATTYFDNWPRTDFTFSPNGELLAAPMAEDSPPSEYVGYAQSRQIGLWSTDNWELEQAIDVEMSIITSCAWSHAQRLLAVAGLDDQPVLRIYQLDEKPDLLGETVVDGLVTAIGFHNNSIAAATTEAVRCWTIDSGSSKTENPVFTDTHAFEINSLVRFIDYSPDGQRLAMALKDENRFRVYDLTNGELCYERDAPRAVCCVRFSPNGRRIALSGYDSLVYLCDAATGYRLLSLKGSETLPGTQAITSRVVFSPDGKRIATNTWQREITVWSADNAKRQ